MRNAWNYAYSPHSHRLAPQPIAEPRERAQSGTGGPRDSGLRGGYRFGYNYSILYLSAKRLRRARAAGITGGAKGQNGRLVHGRIYPGLRLSWVLHALLWGKKYYRYLTKYEWKVRIK